MLLARKHIVSALRKCTDKELCLQRLTTTLSDPSRPSPRKRQGNIIIFGRHFKIHIKDQLKPLVTVVLLWPENFKPTPIPENPSILAFLLQILFLSTSSTPAKMHVCCVKCLEAQCKLIKIHLRIIISKKISNQHHMQYLRCRNFLECG